MYAAGNPWGGSLEITNGGGDSATEDERSRNMTGEWDRSSHFHQLDETQQSWLLEPTREKKKSKYVDLGCVVCSRKLLKWIMWAVIAAFFVIALPIIIAKSIPKHKQHPPPPDQYTQALHKALLFFNAQKSGKLPKNNGVSWRGDSGLQDGFSATPPVQGGLVGGYYDAGDNAKFHFPMSFAMTMLSWSVIEYEHKYRAIGEYDHTRELIKWGTDYLLQTFNNSAARINQIYSQVGGSQNASTVPDDHNCWEKPEYMDYARPVQIAQSAPDLGSEMAAALAAASIVFRDDNAYSAKLVKGATTLFAFAREFSRRRPYSQNNLFIDPYYNSTGYWDEYMWGSAWMYYATGNTSYISLATNPGLPKNANAFKSLPDLSVLSWDNKLPAAMLLLTRLRIFLNPGYPYENMLRAYQNATQLNMCSYLQRYPVFNWTRGGLIELNHGQGQSLQYVANAAFLASLYTDYMTAADIPGWYCGSTFITTDVIRSFATSQMNYILGANPMNTSYVVGYSNKYPKHVHHRGASIPNNHNNYGCRSGFQWLYDKNPNPNTIVGAMVGGPDRNDKFQDLRTNYSYTEPTLAGNAGLVTALVSLTSTGGAGIEKNTIFTAVPPMFQNSPPPPPPWKP